MFHISNMVSELFIEELCCATLIPSISHFLYLTSSLLSSFVVLECLDFLFSCAGSMADEGVTSLTQSEQPTNSYLYLNPSENPAASLVPPVLNSTNYHSWSRSMITALSAKNKVEFILDDKPHPSQDNPNFPAWTRCNNMVVSWLVHFVSPPIRQSII